MASEMCSSNSSKLSSGRRKDKKLKVSADSNEFSGKSIIKEDFVESVRIDETRSSPGKFDSMTVKELRALTRSVGISTRGTKLELIGSLKCYSDTALNGEEVNLGSKNIPQGLHKVSNASVNMKRTRRKKMVESTIGEEGSEYVMEHDELTIAKIKNGAGQSCSQKESKQISLPANTNEPWAMLVHKKPQRDWIPYNPRTMRPPPLKDDLNSFKLISWNVNGLRALLKLETFSALQLAQQENFDVLCLQETKLQEKDVDSIKKNLIAGYENSFWTCSVSKLGYSGTAIISRRKPISVNYGLGILDHDTEGRIVTVEFEKFYLISGYVPNSGDGLKRLAYRIDQWDPSLSNYMKELEKVKPVILTGDLNCAHEEIDIFNPAGNRRSAGFTDEERESFQKNFLSRGFVDTFRRQHPGVVAYTYWGYRHGGRKDNKGWRLDYFLASETIADNVHDSYILPDVFGSDHCPIGLILKL